MVSSADVRSAVTATASRRLTILRGGRWLTADCAAVGLTLDPGRGGCVTLRAGSGRWSLATEVVLELGGRTEHVTQARDPCPRLIVLEEGVERIGLRSLYRLYSLDGALRGEGMQELWATHAGGVFVAVGVRVAAAEPVEILRAELVVGTSASQRPLDDSSLASGEPGNEARVAWPWGRGRRNAGVRWDRTAPPFYERWPSYFDQWSLDPATFGWDRHPSGGYSPARTGFGLAWTRERLPASREADFRSLIWFGFGAPATSAELLTAHETPRPPRLEGASLRGYEELDGAFEIALDGDGVAVGVEPAAGPVRLRVSGLRPGERVDCDGPARVLHTSERGRTDDPLVAVTRHPLAPADEAVVTVDARREPVLLRLRRRPGLHVAYQRRDTARALSVHHPGDSELPVCRIELETLRLRDLRLPGAALPAVYDLPLFYARYLAKAPSHLASTLDEVDVVSDTAELVALRLVSSTPDGGVRSTYELSLPARDDGCVELAVETTLTGADRWSLPTFEFGDLFPEDTIDPDRWDYERLALLAGDELRSYVLRDPYPHLAAILHTPASALDAMIAAHGQPGFGPWEVDGPVGFVFYGSERGTIVGHAATQTPGASCVATLCEHWADLHLDVAFGDGVPVASEIGGGRSANVAELRASLSLLLVPREQGDLDASIEHATRRMRLAQP